MPLPPVSSLPPRMKDAGGKFVIFVNGHPNFLTKACRKKVLEARMQMADSFNCFNNDDNEESEDIDITEGELRDAKLAFSSSSAQDDDNADDRRKRARMRRSIMLSNPDGRGARLLSRNPRLPEPPADELAGARSDMVVTLRLRALPGKSIPELFEGDRIIGTYTVKRASRRRRKGRSRKRKGGNGNGKEDKEDKEKSSDDDDDDDDSEKTEDSGDEVSLSDASSRSGSDEEDDDDDEETKRKRKSSKQKKKRRVLPPKMKIFRVLSIHWGLMPYINLLLQGSAARNGGGSNRSSTDRNCFAICELVG